jgi:hypothetical protein
MPKTKFVEGRFVNGSITSKFSTPILRLQLCFHGADELDQHAST